MPHAKAAKDAKNWFNQESRKAGTKGTRIAAFLPSCFPDNSGFGRAVSRFLSAPLRTERIICLSSQYPEPIPLSQELARAAPLVPYLALHPMGFSVPPRLRLGRCALTTPFHPYRAGCPARRSNFLWHFPSARLTANRPRVSPTEPELRGIAPCGVRTFLPRTSRERSSTLPKPCGA